MPNNTFLFLIFFSPKHTLRDLNVCEIKSLFTMLIHFRFTIFMFG